MYDFHLDSCVGSILVRQTDGWIGLIFLILGDQSIDVKMILFTSAEARTSATAERKSTDSRPKSGVNSVVGDFCLIIFSKILFEH